MSIRAHSRSKGHCVAAALAYRIGCEITDSRTGIRHDFSRRAQRGDVVASGFSYGAQAPAWNRNDVQAFADALEGAERRKNSIVCRDVEIALPHELAPEKREALAARWAQHLASRYNAAVAYAVHRPDRRSDERNHHVHCLMSTRALGKDGTPGAKLRQFHVRAKKPNKQGKPYEPERTDSGGSDEIHTLRAEWEVMCNEALAEAGIDTAIAMGRLEDPRDRAPNLTRGEVEAERNGWRKRHPKTRQLPMRVAQLVVDDGVCVTKRGRKLARHVSTRVFIEHVTGRPVTRPQALPAAEPEPERALAATQTIQPVRASSPAPDRPARRRRRRRAHRIRAVERSATPEPTLVQGPGRVQESLSPIRPVEALLTTAPTPISLPARTQDAQNAVRTIDAFTVPTPIPVTAPERSRESLSPIRPVEAPLTPAPARIPVPPRVIERRIATLRARLARLAQLVPLRAYVQQLGVIRAVQTPFVPTPEPVRPLARIVENLRRAMGTRLTMRGADDVMIQGSEIERARQRRSPAVRAHTDSHGQTPMKHRLSREERDIVADVLKEVEHQEMTAPAQTSTDAETAQEQPQATTRRFPDRQHTEVRPGFNDPPVSASLRKAFEPTLSPTAARMPPESAKVPLATAADDTLGDNTRTDTRQLNAAETDLNLSEFARSRPTDRPSSLDPSPEELDIVAKLLREVEQQEMTAPAQTSTGAETAQEQPQATTSIAEERARLQADYGADAIQLVEEFRRLQAEHGDLGLRIKFDGSTRSVVGIDFVDARGTPCYSLRTSASVIAAMEALMDKRPPNAIREIERTIERDIAAEVARVRERQR